MATISVELFIGYIAEWATARNKQFNYNWPVKGGWEGWLQVDLVAYILWKDSTAEILREQQIYTSPYMRTDLLLNTALSTDDQIPVEIKVESFENKMDPFITGVSDDILKLNTERNTNFSECTCVMVAVPFSTQSLQAVLGISEGGHPIFVPVFLGEIAVAVAVYTEAGGWLPVSGSPAKAVTGTMSPPS